MAPRSAQASDTLESGSEMKQPCARKEVESLVMNVMSVKFVMFVKFFLVVMFPDKVVITAVLGGVRPR